MKSMHSEQFDERKPIKSPSCSAPLLLQSSSTNRLSLLLLLLGALELATPINCASSFKQSLKFSHTVTLEIEGNLKFEPPRKHTLSLTIDKPTFVSLYISISRSWIPTDAIKQITKNDSDSWHFKDPYFEETYEEHPQCFVLKIMLNIYQLLTNERKKYQFSLTSPSYGTPIQNDFCLQTYIQTCTCVYRVFRALLYALLY